MNPYGLNFGDFTDWAVTGPAPVEPSSDLRQMAALCRQQHLALIGEGFTRHEATYLIGRIIAATFESTT